ncbi:MAG: hypothetical protein SPL15_07245 [Lachnospiraceae bacterium]|nr:hypothetical protein [Lachnospiraceae bacterium]
METAEIFIFLSIIRETIGFRQAELPKALALPVFYAAKRRNMPNVLFYIDFSFRLPHN